MSGMAAAGVAAPPVSAPARLMDFRRGVPWVAQFLKLALHSPARDHRAEALDELRETMTADELRRLAAWFEEAARLCGTVSSGTDAAAVVP
jgi:hypothetical protein